MLFNSVIFLYAFLPVAYLVFWALKKRERRYQWLTLTGYVFYGFWNYKFCALMAFSTVVSYLAGLGMLRWSDDPRRKKLCLIVPVVTDLALLGFFKYTGFLLATTDAIASRIGLPIHAPAFDIVLPIGISFYTFHTISYMVDSYRGTIRPTRNFFEFAAYVSLFCQLVAGPIVRFGQIEADLDAVGSVDRRRYWDRGWSFFVIGMIKKVVIADTIASIIDPAFASYASLSTPATWALMLGYTYQLYFDFSGYSDMAVGLGALFGLRIPQNFNSPYKATDPSDFWRRWHISLSSCLRDYLYIPLGGNRRFPYRNLMLTMLLGGLWHGASWTFVAWGTYHGLLLAAYKRFGRSYDQLPVAARRLLMFLAAVVGWVFFRSTSFEMAGTLLAHMFNWHSGATMTAARTLLLALGVCTLVTQVARNTFELPHDWSRPQALALASGFCLALAMTYGFRMSPFLYFQF